MDVEPVEPRRDASQGDLDVRTVPLAVEADRADPVAGDVAQDGPAGPTVSSRRIGAGQGDGQPSGHDGGRRSS